MVTAALVPCAPAFAADAATAAEQDVARQHDQAIALARSGKNDEALVILERLARDHPDDLGIARDLVVILTWAGRDADAALRYEALPKGDQPDYVVEAAARAYRDLHRYPEALALYRAGSARFAARRSLFVAGEIETLADMGDPTAALARAEQDLHERGDTLTTLVAAGYAALAAHVPVETLRYVDRALKLDPKHREALRERVRALDAMGAPQLALSLLAADPDLLSADEVRRIEGNAAAQLVRWNPLEPDSEAQRFAAADRSLAMLDGLIARWSREGEPARGALLRARFDRLVALHDRARMSECIADYEALLRDGAEPPAYVLPSVAAAYLYLHHPETARDIFRRAVAADPDDVDAQLGLFHALVETEEFDAALEQVDATAARFERVKPQSQDPQKFDADVAAANARFYADDLVEAERRFATMSERAPNNATLLVGLAQVHNARGWPRRALEDTEIAQGQQPQDSGTQIVRTNIDFDLQDWRRFQRGVDDLSSRLPENADVQHLVRRSVVHDSAELDLYVNRALKSATNVNGGNGINGGAQLYSPPIAYDWRVFSGFNLAHERLPEGQITERVYDAGIDYRVRDLTASAEARLATFGTERGGGKLAAEWSPNDYWQFGGGGEIFSADTPLRALRHGITADALSANAIYQASESRLVKGNAEVMTFSDGNLRSNFGVEWKERLYTEPHLRVDGITGLGASRNTRTDAPYYNPRSDGAASFGIDITHILYRRYEFTYEHGFTAAAGAYWEQHFGTGLAWNARYEQRVKDDLHEAALGVTFSRQPYDRVYENAITISASLTWKF